MGKPPKKDEVEISVFGPGYGECILIHMGFNEWIIVDSCLNPKTRKPAGLEYLKSIGVSADYVQLVIATHWHDDHIRGLSETLKACKNSEFVMSEALRQEEFLTLLSHFGTEPMIKGSSGTQEFFSILNHLEEVGKPPKRAIADRTLWLKSKPFQSGITSLSPSDRSIYLSNWQIAKRIQEIGFRKERLLSITPNHSAVVLWVQIHEIAVLLGSDLEVTTDKGCGWIAILESKTRPNGKADFFKVPHHGSENGDHPRIWDELISKNAVIALTPFQQGGTKLPRNSDIQRICQQRSRCYITATHRKKKVKTDRTVDKMIEKVGGIRSRRKVHGDFGQLRVRGGMSIKSSSEWKIETIDGSKCLC